MEETYMEQDAPAAADPSQIYLEAATLAQGLTAQELKQAVALFESIPDYLDAPQRAAAVRNQYIELLHKEQAELQAQKAAKLKQYLLYGSCIAGAAALLITIIVLVASAITNSNTYKDALALMAQENYAEAITLFESLEDYKDAPGMLEQAQYLREQQLLDQDYDAALKLVEAKEYAAAIDAFEQLGSHRDSRQQLEKARELLQLQQEEAQRAETYAAAAEMLKSGDDEKENEAYQLLTQLGDYKDAPQLLSKFRRVVSHMNFDSSSSKYTDYTENYTYNDIGKVADTHQEFQQTYSKTFQITIHHTYDSNGNEELATYEYPNTSTSQLGNKNVASEESVYDGGGRLIDRCTTYIDETVKHEYYRWYDEEGNLLSPELSDEYLASHADPSQNYLLTNRMINSEGQILRTWQETVSNEGVPSGQRNKETVYEYNSEGRIARILTYTGAASEDATPSTTTYIYTDQGRLLRIETDSTVTHYGYNEEGDLLTLTYGQIISRPSNSVWSDTEYEIEYEYIWVYAPNAE